MEISNPPDKQFKEMILKDAQWTQEKNIWT